MMIKHKNKILLIILTPILVSMMLLTAYKLTSNSSSSQDQTSSPTERLENDQEKEGFTDDAIVRCKDLLDSVIVGSWQYLEGPLIKLDADKRFSFKNDAYEITGSWELGENKSSIKLYFDELDEYWMDRFNDPYLYEYPDSVVSDDIENKMMEFNIGYYAGTNNRFEGECQSSTFYINIFNAYYYKAI